MFNILCRRWLRSISRFALPQLWRPPSIGAIVEFCQITIILCSVVTVFVAPHRKPTCVHIETHQTNFSVNVTVNGHRKQHRSAIWFHCTISSPETVRRPSNRADETGGNFRSPKHIEKKLAFSWLPRPSMADMVKIMFETIKSATIFLRRHIVSACTFKKHFNYMKTFYKLAVKI